jgi:hypothetical protein
MKYVNGFPLFVNDLLINHFNMKGSTGMVLFDIEKAFDTVCFRHKLISINVLPRLISLINDFFANRSFVVSVNDTISSPRNVSDGVPQDFLLGPFLFNVFINDGRLYLIQKSKTYP